MKVEPGVLREMAEWLKEMEETLPFLADSTPSKPLKTERVQDGMTAEADQPGRAEAETVTERKEDDNV